MLGNRIKQYRENNKMTQNEIANILEVSPATISKYEAGTLEPNIESLKRLSETFNVSIDLLLKEDSEEYNISKYNLLDILQEQKNIRLKGNLYHNTQIFFSFNSNHIEGSTLTEEQTRYIFETNSILFEKNTIANINDIMETTNHFKLLDYMLDTAKEPLTEEMIKQFHKILKQGTSDSQNTLIQIGEYKKLPNEVGYSKTTPPKNVPKEMAKLLNWYNSLSKITIKEIIDFHAKFEKIHPFQDGNGRVGRIIMFKECLKNNITPFIIFDKDKLFYYRGLKEYISGREKGYLIDTCLNAQDQYMKLVEYYLG